MGDARVHVLAAARAVSEEVVERWEAAALGRDLGHLEHVEIAWRLVRRHGRAEAERRLVAGTLRNCEAAGAPEKEAAPA